MPVATDADANNESSWKTAFKTKTRLREDGKLYDAARPCQWIPGDGRLQSIDNLEFATSSKSQEQNHGNEKDLKYASTYWHAPQGVQIERFRLVTQGCTVGQTFAKILQMQTANPMERVSLWNATTGAMIPGATIYPESDGVTTYFALVVMTAVDAQGTQNVELRYYSASNGRIYCSDPFVHSPGERLGSLTGAGYATHWK